MEKAPRVAFFLKRGYWPEPCALHHCDNTLCVRDEHLFEGDQGDNARDRASKGRNGSVSRPDRVARGDRHSSRTHPERIARGERHSSRTHPESVPRGDAHYARRSPEKVTRGEAKGTAKLTTLAVLEIRRAVRAGEMAKDVAKRFGVSAATVSRIVKGTGWAHVANEESA